MKKIILSLLIISSFFTACNKNNDQDRKATYDYFSTQLKVDMNYDAIVSKFGQPSADKGSGIHIYVYKLDDGTEIWIGYADKIIYARQMDSNGQLLRTII